MDAERQEERKLRSTKATSRPKYVVGMDAHSRKLAISIWEGSDPWHPARLGENPRCDISRMKQYYEEKVPMDSITIIEASTNSALLKGMLDEIGFRAEVVRSDAIADRQRKRKVCDINDARELANAYIHGEIKEFVWTPSPEYAEYRDVLFSYRDAVKETTRTSNRIWSICCRCGFDFDIKAGETKADSIRAMIAELGVGGFVKERLEMLVRDYEYFLKRRDELERLIAEAVVQSGEMTALMQLPGVFFLAAFATQTLVEDARRFDSASKLAAYGGFAMIGNTSGEDEEKSKRRGGTGKPLDGEGRKDLKTLYCEAGHTVLNRCGGMKIGIVGATSYLEGNVMHSHLDGMKRLNTIAEVNRWAEFLKKEKKCDLVIFLSHLGYRGGTQDRPSDEILVAASRNIDLVIGGHSHTFIKSPLIVKDLDGKDVPIVQAGCQGVQVGKFEIY